MSLVQLQVERWHEPLPLSQRLLAFLEPERELPSSSEDLRQAVTGSALESDLYDVTPLPYSRFPGRYSPDACGMGRIII
jgi:hypothetical protein